MKYAIRLVSYNVVDCQLRMLKRDKDNLIYAMLIIDAIKISP